MVTFVSDADHGLRVPSSNRTSSAARFVIVCIVITTLLGFVQVAKKDIVKSQQKVPEMRGMFIQMQVKQHEKEKLANEKAKRLKSSRKA